MGIKNLSGILTKVPDYVQVDDSSNPLQYSQVFHLIPDGVSYYVYVSRFSVITRDLADKSYCYLQLQRHLPAELRGMMDTLNVESDSVID